MLTLCFQSDGDFVVDDDEELSEEESEDDAAAASWLPQGKPQCRFGMNCTRKNPVHFLEEAHPPAHPNCPPVLQGGASALPPATIDALVPPTGYVPLGKPACRFGLSCRRQNPLHFAEESHPPEHPNAVMSAPDSDGYVPLGKPQCKFGLNCKRHNPLHFAEESHPAAHPNAAGNRPG